MAPSSSKMEKEKEKDKEEHQKSDHLKLAKEVAVSQESMVSSEEHKVLIRSISGNINNLEELVNVIDNRLKMFASKQKSMALNFSDIQVQ